MLSLVWAMVVTAAPVRAGAPRGAEPQPVPVHRDGDFVVFGDPLPPRAAHATAAPGAGHPDDGRTASNGSAAVVVHDGYATFGDPTLLDRYEVRLVFSRGIEELRPHVERAAAAAAAARGEAVVVRRGTVPRQDPGHGQIDLVISEFSPCASPWLGCGGPVIEDGTVVGGRIWIHPRVMSEKAHALDNTLRHELGHTLGLAHYEPTHEGVVQTMHPTSVRASRYEAGDVAGLVALSGGSHRPEVAVGSAVRIDAIENLPGSIRIRGLADGAKVGSVLVTTIGERSDRRSMRSQDFEVEIPADAGTHRVCVTVEYDGASEARTCADHVVPGAPSGAVTSVASTPIGVVVQGWATDPQSAGPVEVVVTVGGVATRVRADRGVPGAGVRRHFVVARAIGAGTHDVCVVVIDVGGGPDTDLGCRSTRVAPGGVAGVGVQVL